MTRTCWHDSFHIAGSSKKSNTRCRSPSTDIFRWHSHMSTSRTCSLNSFQSVELFVRSLQNTGAACTDSVCFDSVSVHPSHVQSAMSSWYFWPGNCKATNYKLTSLTSSLPNQMCLSLCLTIFKHSSTPEQRKHSRALLEQLQKGHGSPSCIMKGKGQFSIAGQNCR